MTEISDKAAEIINNCLDDGYGWQDILNFLCDGEALANANITDEDIVNEAYSFCEEMIKRTK